MGLFKNAPTSSRKSQNRAIDDDILRLFFDTGDSVGQIGQQRSEMLNAMLEHISIVSGGAALWLADTDQTEGWLTLWAIVFTDPSMDRSRFAGTSTKSSKTWPTMQEPALSDNLDDLRALFNLDASKSPLSTFDNLDNSTPSDVHVDVIVPIFNPVSAGHGARGNGDDCRAAGARSLPPLLGEQLIGVIEILGLQKPGWSPETTKAELANFAHLFGARINIGRRQRTLDALQEYQAAIRNMTDMNQVCQTACELLRRYTSASHASIWQTSRHDSISLICEARLVGDDSTSELSRGPTSGISTSNAVRRAGVTHEVHFTSNSSPGPRIVRVPDIEQLMTLGGAVASSGGRDESLIDMEGISPIGTRVSWLSATVATPGTRKDHLVPLVTVKLLNTPRSAFMGGHFSRADQELVKTISEYLGDVIPDLRLRQSTQLLTERAIGSRGAYQPRGTFDDLTREIDEHFSGIATSLIPVASNAWIVRQRFDPSTRVETTICSGSNGSPSHPIISYDWDATSPKLLQSAAGGQTFWWFVAFAGMEKVALLVELSGGDIAADEAHLLRLLASDLVLRWHGQLDVRERLRQVAELRHALRNGLNGVLNHTKTALEMYEAQRGHDAPIIVDELYRRAGFRKSLQRARLSATEMHAFFEDVRIVYAGLSRDDLQLSRYDIVGLVEELRNTALVEIQSKSLDVNINTKRYSRHAPQPLVDVRLMKIAIFNLLDNAIKYSRRGRVVQVDLIMAGALWGVTVNNHGRIITKDEIARLSEPLYRGEAAPGEQRIPGTGMGLAGVMRIIKAHSERGRLIIESDPEPPARAGQSSRTAYNKFGFELPRDL